MTMVFFHFVIVKQATGVNIKFPFVAYHSSLLQKVNVSTIVVTYRNIYTINLPFIRNV